MTFSRTVFVVIELRLLRQIADARAFGDPASPVISLSMPAMIRSRVDLPDR
jgi:hypothetical protein